MKSAMSLLLLEILRSIKFMAAVLNQGSIKPLVFGWVDLRGSAEPVKNISMS